MHTIVKFLQENLILTSMIIQDLWSESNKNFEVILNLKTSPFAIQDKKLRDLDLAKEYPTLKDLMKEQGVSTDLADYWDKECNDNSSKPNCLIYDN